MKTFFFFFFFFSTGFSSTLEICKEFKDTSELLMINDLLARNMETKAVFWLSECWGAEMEKLCIEKKGDFKSITQEESDAVVKKCANLFNKNQNK